jgi:hypothetical protein
LRVGPVDQLPAEEVMALIPALPIWADVPSRKRGLRLRGASTILQWLQQHPGEGWQDRWLAADADRDTGWLDDIVAADSRSPVTKRDEVTQGLGCLLLCRVVLPDYDFLAQYRAKALFGWVRHVFRPDLFSSLERAADDQKMQPPQLLDGLRAISKMVLRNGRDVDQLTAEDIYTYREWFHRRFRGADRGVQGSWDLLQGRRGADVRGKPGETSYGRSKPHHRHPS